MANKTGKSSEKRLWQVCLSLGINLSISIYLLGPLLGSFIDRKLGSAPLFLIIGVLLAIVICFYRLFWELRLLEKQEKAAARDKAIPIKDTHNDTQQSADTHSTEGK